jgi:hypothetical protein
LIVTLKIYNFYYIRFLHLKSNGNPGWIGTCLSTLLESGKLKIQKINIDSALKLGITFTEEKFMKRYSIWKAFDIDTDWRMYKTSFDDEFYSLRNRFKNCINYFKDKNDNVKIAVLNEEITNNDYITDLTMERKFFY